MPSPYSDNLYSDPDAVGSNPATNRGDDASAASDLSPSDGYFRHDDDSGVSPTSQLSSHASRRTGSTPYVPNILVADPTLAKDPDSKAQIAQHLINSDAGPGAPSTSSPHPHHDPESYYYPSASASVSGASIATPSTVTSYPYAPSSRHPSSAQDGHSQRQHRQLHVSTAPQHQPSNYNPSAYQGRGDAPPAYTPSSPDDPNRYSYSTFPSSTPHIMGGTPEEHDRLLSPHQQQAFSDPPKQPLWRRIRDSHDSGSLRKKVKKILGILVFISIILVFMGFNMSGPRYRKRIIDKSPIRIPDMDESELVWHAGRSCRDSPHTYPKKTFHATPSSERVLFIEQTIRKADWIGSNPPMPSVNGEVILRPTKSGKAELDVEIIANYEDLDIEVEFSTNGHTDHLKVTTPRIVPEARPRDVCIQIRITAWIPEEALVNALSVKAVSLDVFVQEGLVLGAENEVQFSTVSGNLNFPAGDSDIEPYKLEAPSYKYLTVSGDVEGWFPMYHNLRADTVSGDIFAQITHKDIVLKESGSSLLHISSVSGELEIKDGSQDAGAAGAKIRARDYHVKMSTKSGDITANVLIGSSSAFSSTSGNVNLKLVPVLDDRTSWRPLLKTQTTSGGHRVQIAEPQFITITDQTNTLPETVKDQQSKETPNQDGAEISENKRGLTAFESRHSSVSGSVHLNYPASWEGTFSVNAISSVIDVGGKGVVVDEKKGEKPVAGHKGDGTSSLKINEVSGKIVLTIGQE